MRLPVPGLTGRPVAGGDPFAALGDPTRRHILELMVTDGPTTATALAGRLDISRQAVAKHLQLLAGAGVARFERVGRETRYEARPEGFADVRTWIDRVEHRWTARLDRLAASLESGPTGDGGG